MWARSGSFSSACVRAVMWRYFSSRELIALTWTITSFCCRCKGRPIWYMSVSGDTTRILLQAVFLTWSQIRVSVSLALHTYAGSGCFTPLPSSTRVYHAVSVMGSSKPPATYSSCLSCMYICPWRRKYILKYFTKVLLQSLQFSRFSLHCLGTTVVSFIGPQWWLVDNTEDVSLLICSKYLGLLHCPPGLSKITCTSVQPRPNWLWMNLVNKNFP